MTFHEDQVAAWSSPPVDNLNAYVPSRDLMARSDAELRELVTAMAEERYGPNGWRNHNRVWTEVLLGGDLAGKRVLDYGCGVGLEAVSLSGRGAHVDIADISGDNLQLAARAVRILGNPGYGGTMFLVDDHMKPWPPTAAPPGSYDMIHCMGVLHHIPNPWPVVEHFWNLLKPGGELRLMLYTDQCWRNQTATEPPSSAASADEVHAHPAFQQFVRAMDQVGQFAEPYSVDKIEHRFSGWFTINRWVSMTPWDNYSAIILTREPCSRCGDTGVATHRRVAGGTGGACHCPAARKPQGIPVEHTPKDSP